MVEVILNARECFIRGNASIIGSLHFEGQDDKAAYHQDLHCFKDKIDIQRKAFVIMTCNSSIYTMDYPGSTVSIFTGMPLVLKGLIHITLIIQEYVNALT